MVSASQIAERLPLPLTVTQATGHLKGELVERSPVAPVAARLKEPEERGGHFHRQGSQPTGLSRSLLSGGDQVVPLSLQPQDCVLAIPKPHAIDIASDIPSQVCRREQPVGALGGCQIAAQRPSQCGALCGRPLLSVGLLARKQSQQVVQTISSRYGALKHLGVDQSFENRLHRCSGFVDQSSRDRNADVRPVQQSQEPKDASGQQTVFGIEQRLIAELKAGPDRQVAKLQVIQSSAFVGKLFGQSVQGPARASGQAGAGDPQRQRQKAALL